MSEPTERCVDHVQELMNGTVLPCVLPKDHERHQNGTVLWWDSSEGKSAQQQVFLARVDSALQALRQATFALEMVRQQFGMELIAEQNGERRVEVLDTDRT